MEIANLRRIKSKKKRESNEKMLSRLMKFSRRGMLMQLMVLQGLEIYCKAVVDTESNADKQEEFDAMCRKAGIHGPAWRDCCHEFLDNYEAHRDDHPDTWTKETETVK